LNIDQSVSGLVILDSNNVTISIGADSSMLIRLEEDANAVVTGEAVPEYHNFDAGIIFVSDYEKGLLFSPIYPTLNISGMPYARDLDIRDYAYGEHCWDTYANDYRDIEQELDDIGLKNWVLDPNFSSANWAVTYNFKKGDGFIASVFPPKSFDNNKYAKERVDLSDNLTINSSYKNSDYEYYIQNFKERNSILLFGCGGYDYCVNENAPNDVWHRAIQGPYEVAEPNALTRLVTQAHEQDVEVIVYMTPSYYYTSEPNAILENLAELVNTYNIDGVYFDGRYTNRPLKTLTLVRRARNLLQDKFYVQHSSHTCSLIYASEHFRLPFYDAYADRIWLGEGVKKDWTQWSNFGEVDADPNNWGLLYCNKNLSNTSSTLLSEYRPIDYGDPNGSYLTLSPSEQINNQLGFNGVFRVYSYLANYESYISYGQDGLKTYFDARNWWDPFNEKCLAYTSGDGVGDVGETFYTAQADCAPESSKAVLTNSGSAYQCESDYSVAQWLIDDTPFYRLHFTFDNEIATDDSSNRMNANRLTGIRSYGNAFKEPSSATVDGKEAFYFDGTERLYVDGNKEAQDNVTLHGMPDFGIYSIGAYAHYTYDNYFKGYIDDLFVTDRELTEQQVSQYHDYIHKTLTVDANSVDCIITNDDDPCFVDAGNDDFHLDANSWCIDLGDPNVFIRMNMIWILKIERLKPSI